MAGAGDLRRAAGAAARTANTRWRISAWLHFLCSLCRAHRFSPHQRHLAQGAGHGRSNCETLFGITKIPSDNHIRDMLMWLRWNVSIPR
jgi:hypothetical protein